MNDSRSKPLLLLLLRGRLGLVELGRKLFIGLLAKGLFNELARIAARFSGKTMSRDCGFALGADDDFNGLHAAPPCP